MDRRASLALVGEKVAEIPQGPVEVKISVCCPGDVDRIKVCRNNQFIYANSPPGREADLVFVDRDPLQRRSYYYVRVIQKDEEIAWTSPVWFGAE